MMHVDNTATVKKGVGMHYKKKCCAEQHDATYWAQQETLV
jgi:hypothetical protein